MNLSNLIINFASSVVINSPLTPPIIIVPPLQPQGQEHLAVKSSSYKVASATSLLASWYGPGFDGGETASGEPFNQYDLTVAHPYLPFGTIIEITYNGASVQARVNDRGPYTGGREIDLSAGVANAIGFDGVNYVQVRVLYY